MLIASVLAIAPTIVWICNAWNRHMKAASSGKQREWAWTPLQIVAVISMSSALLGQHIYFEFAARGDAPSNPLLLFAPAWFVTAIGAIVVVLLTLRFGPIDARWLALALLHITVLGFFKALLDVASYMAAV